MRRLIRSLLVFQVARQAARGVARVLGKRKWLMMIGLIGGYHRLRSYLR